MPNHKLFITDFENPDYEIIILHTFLDDARLAFKLNQLLTLRLKREEKNIEITTKKGVGKFISFTYNDKEKKICWRLLENKSFRFTPKATTITNLFSDISSVNYLLPEYKKADYILKIENIDNSFKKEEVISKLHNITQLSLFYSVNKKNLKSKYNLIF